MLAVLAHRIIAWHLPVVDGIWLACLIGLSLRNAGWTPWWAEAGLRWSAWWISAAAVVGVLVQGVLTQVADHSTAEAVARMLVTTAVVAVAAQVDLKVLSAKRGLLAAGGALVGVLAVSAALPLVLGGY